MINFVLSLFGGPLPKLFRKPLSEEQAFFFPTVVATLVICLAWAAVATFQPVPEYYRSAALLCDLATVIYLALVYLVFYDRLQKVRYINWILPVLNAFIFSINLVFEFPYAHIFFLIILSMIIFANAILFGRWPTYLFAIICFITDSVLTQQSVSSIEAGFFIDFLPIPVFTIVIVETIRLLLSRYNAQVHRLQVLNMVAKSVSSSLEIKQVITLLNSTIQNALDADTYYVGLMDSEGKALHLELLYDDGEFYPASDLPLQNTLAGWVIHNRKSLFSGNLPQDMPDIGVRRFVVGQPRASLSWMGTPLSSGDHILGLVAVAAYKYDAFNKADLELLENVAQQASLAIDNAYHHAEVEKRSLLDSLTLAFNHSAFIQKLDDSIAESDMTGLPLSVIMLDIDHFKSYNDRYGHLVGDKVLTRLTEVIHQHIRETDYVGRWGGEEFSIALVGADVRQAYQIAQRIQKSLSEIEFISREGASIPAPTVSQGIATYPCDADGTYTLIDEADQRLYVAKNRGRDEIEPHVEEQEESIKPV